MKKLFISVPMKGRKQEDIEYSIGKMKKIAEALFDEELEVIDSYKPEFKDKPPVYCLGQSISFMSEADYFIGTEQQWYGNEVYCGCEIERNVAFNYGIEYFLVPFKNVLSKAEKAAAKEKNKSYEERCEERARKVDELIDRELSIADDHDEESCEMCSEPQELCGMPDR